MPTLATAVRREALLAAADRAGRLIQAVHELAAGVEAEAKSRDWAEGEILALFRDGVSAWSTLLAYGLLRVRHDVIRGNGHDAAGEDGSREDWAMASAKLAEQVAGQDAAGAGDATRLRPTIANMLDRYDRAAAACAARVGQADADGQDGGMPYAPLHELASHGFGGPGEPQVLADRFEAVIVALTPAADEHIRRIYA
jgi:hypothetical protein